MENNTCHEIKKNSKKACVFVLALGGTISSIVKDPAEEFYRHPSSNVDKLLSSLPIDYKVVTVLSEQFLQQISHEMTHDNLVLVAKKINDLVNNDEIDGIVVAQGTNCIEETAYFINLVIKTKKCIVFTGAHRPLNALGFDGNRNLYNAILLASSPKTSRIGVILTFNDCIIHARDASKLNPSLLGEFSSHGLGVLGFLQGNQILIQRSAHNKHTYLSEFDINQVNEEHKIYIIYGHLGMDSAFIEVAMEKQVKGIISAGMGKGYQTSEVTKRLAEASKRGIFVVRCSRSGQGIVNQEPNFDDRHGFIAGGSLNPQKARILLSVAISVTQDRMNIQRIFDEY